MAITSKVFFFTVLLALFISAEGMTCKSSDIIIEQVKTGSVIEGKPEYYVTVRNRCVCPQSKVVLQCYGLSSVEAVDPRAIRPLDGERCMVAGGRPITKGTPVKFKYAWLTPQDFPVLSSSVHC